VRRGGVRHALAVAIPHGFKKILVIFLDGVSTDNDARVGHVGCVLSKERGDSCRIVRIECIVELFGVIGQRLLLVILLLGKGRYCKGHNGE
jgi:hypothetical protein